MFRYQLELDSVFAKKEQKSGAPDDETQSSIYHNRTMLNEPFNCKCLYMDITSGCYVIKTIHLN